MLDYPGVVWRCMRYGHKQKKFVFNKLTKIPFISHVRNQIPGFIDTLLFFFFYAKNVISQLDLQHYSLDMALVYFLFTLQRIKLCPL